MKISAGTAAGTSVLLRDLLFQANVDAKYFGDNSILITGVTADSREVAAGFMYAAILGVRDDGHRFIPEAVQKGAVAILSEGPAPAGFGGCWVQIKNIREALPLLAASFYKDPTRSIQVIGITGTNGKTTVSYLLEHIWKSTGLQTGILGTVNYRFAGREIPAVETTPGPVRLQALFADMRDAGVSHAAMEVSSHALDQSRVEGIRFGAAVFTNLTQDHLDYHGSMEDYFKAKAKLFEKLGAGRPAVINQNDDRWEALAGRTPGKVVTYAVEKPADFSARELFYHPDGRTSFQLTAQGKTRPVFSPLTGPYNVSNVLAAMAAAVSTGTGLEEATRAIESFGGVPGRLESVEAGQNFKVYIDFAHTPDGLENVLSALRKVTDRRLLAVFGCGGDRDRTKRPKMAAIAARYCDHVFLTSDNPRSEDPKQILEEIRDGFPADFIAYTVIADRPRAVRQALMAAREGDAVLLAGKGHERVQIVGERRIPYHERTEAEKILNGF